MSVNLSVTNLNDVLKDLETYGAKADEAIKQAIYVTGLAVEAQAKKNASGRPGPNVRTGNLRRSITTEQPIKGFGGLYTVEVRATMVYARAVEFGHPRWKPGVKYPYLGPAAGRLSDNGTLSRVFTTNLATRLRG
jgi:hypothetical protein